MRHRIVPCIVLFLCLGILLTGCKVPGQIDNGSAGAAYEVTDITGETIQMPSKPKRILTLSMSTDEIMLGLVKPGQMAGVNALLDDPVSSNIVDIAKTIPVKITNPSVEEIVSLQPDLIIVPDWGNLEQVGALRELGLKVVVCKGAKSMQEIRETIDLLAAAAGEKERGQVLLQKMDTKLAEVKEKTDKIPPEARKRVVLISIMAAYGGIGCTFDDACGYAGVINGMAEAGIHTGQTMSKEQLVKINPDILFLPTYNNHGKYDVKNFRNDYLEDPSLQTVRAIHDGNLKEPREAYIYNGSQDIVFGVQEIAYMAYGEAFAQPANEHLSAAE
jgi:iron complex transport system substrate-binding protein